MHPPPSGDTDSPDSEQGRVYIVDDDMAVRESLAALLDAKGYVARAFPSAADFLDAAPTLRPGCLIADIRMPGMDGLEMQEHLVQRALPFPLIVITGHGDVPLAVRAMKAGAIDFIEKPFAPEAIVASAETALARLQPSARQEQAVDSEAANRLAALSSREREVLECLLAGLPNKTIAYDLGISPRTVEIHRARVMGKMQVRSLSELVRIGLAAGMQPRDRGRG